MLFNSSNMPQLLTDFVVLLHCHFSAEQRAPRQQTIRSSHNIPKAPVGHRQPTPRDLSATKRSDDNGLLGDAADDEVLDSKIKSICRGCF
jgi:hypothetical protein